MQQPRLTGIGRTLGVIAVVAQVACSENDDYESLRKLRVVAARAEAPFAKPDSEVKLELLYWDASPNARRAEGTKRAVQTLWLGGCTNPAGDAYQLCMPYLHQLLDRLGDQALVARQLPSDLPAGLVGWDSTFTSSVASDSISSRPVAPGVVYPYGLQVYFFVVCGGQLARLLVDQSTFPLGCVDPDTGHQLTRDDFDIGYFPVFVYDSIENQNPILLGSLFQNSPPGSACSEQSPCPDDYHCGSSGRCIPRVPPCTESDRTRCPGYRLDITVPRSTVEPAVSAQVPASEAPPEALWVTYYSSSGSWEQRGRTIHDPHSGWAEDFSGAWRADATSNSEARLLAVVRDNRNGVSWAWQDVWIE